MGHKEIIEGKAYNTDTSVLVHEAKYRDEDRYAGLYQTKHGAFFVWWYDANYGEGGIKPLADEDALKWLQKHKASAVVLEHYFGKFPEGGASEMRITIRLPGNLYAKITKSAKSADQSTNTYIMRTLERHERSQQV